MEVHAKLLRVLQEKEVVKVGSQKPEKIDLRVIAATNSNIKEMITNKSFREDLYYRLNVFPIETPALSERTDDLPLLIAELLKRQAKHSQATVKFTEHAMQSLQLHSWPGNVRELANLLERMVIMYPDQVVDVAELPQKYRHLDVESYVPQYPESLQERDLLNELFQSADDDELAEQDTPDISGADGALQQLPEQGLDLKEYLAELEIRFISQALERHEFVVARAAEVLGLRRTTLVEKMRKYNLAKDE